MKGFVNAKGTPPSLVSPWHRSLLHPCRAASENRPLPGRPARPSPRTPPAPPRPPSLTVALGLSCEESQRTLGSLLILWATAVRLPRPGGLKEASAEAPVGAALVGVRRLQDPAGREGHGWVRNIWGLIPGSPPPAPASDPHACRGLPGTVLGVSSLAPASDGLGAFQSREWSRGHRLAALGRLRVGGSPQGHAALRGSGPLPASTSSLNRRRQDYSPGDLCACAQGGLHPGPHPSTSSWMGAL